MKNFIVIGPILAAIAVGAGAASLGGWWIQSTGESAPRSSAVVEPLPLPGSGGQTGASAATLARMERELDESRRERASLSKEVQELRGEVSRMASLLASSAQADRSQAASSGNADSAAKHAGSAARRPGSIDVEALVQAGFAEEEVRTFQSRMDQIELDRLYLRDTATREGWLGTARYREESEALSFDRRSAREGLGDDFYDWMLYTSGHPNRVQVDQVMSGSAAADVGLEMGDTIVGYDDQRIFTPSDLRDATSRGEAGEMVVVDVVRGGVPTRVSVPRGPLGVRVEMTTEEPPTAG